MAKERDIARLSIEEKGPPDSDYVALVLWDYFCDETSRKLILNTVYRLTVYSETDYEAVEDMEERGDKRL
uniref:Uncharacterized protein n=1 Tax=Amphimedon queenslandica TaxID=400682 RepID=A0A1X7V6I1_AMPQE